MNPTSEMSGMIMQVDRVASIEEAVAFRDAGASLIGVALDPDARYGDGRTVSPGIASAIRAAIAPARLVGLVPGGFSRNIAEVRAAIEALLVLGPAYLQAVRGTIPDELVPLVRSAEVLVIEDGASLDSDHGAFIQPEDPAGFIRRQLGDPSLLRPALCHLDVIPDRDDPWLFLVNEAPDWPGEAPQTADIAAAARELPLLLSLTGLGPRTIGSYVQAFAGARGFFARLGPDGGAGPPATAPEPLLDALGALRDVWNKTEPGATAAVVSG